jgi:hypothetical protein
VSKGTPRAIAAVFFLAGCTAMPSNYLVPPSGATPDRIARDVRECIESAKATVASQPGPLTQTELSQLENHPTKGFLCEGRPCVRQNGALVVPNASGSLFVNIPSSMYPIIYPKGVAWYGPVEVTDRYVLGRLTRGYRWPERVDPKEVEVHSAGDAKAGGMQQPPWSVRVSHLAVTPWQMMYRQWDQCDKPGPYRACNTAGKYIVMLPAAVAATPIYLLGYYLPGGGCGTGRELNATG